MFKKTVNGVVDPKINTKGRPLVEEETEKKLTNRQKRERELMVLARKFKPLQAVAIATSAKIMQNNQASDQNRLKASALIISVYQELLKDVYSKEYDESTDVQEIQPANKGAIFSLTMVKNGEIVAES